MMNALPPSCPKCGCESAGDPERVWKGPVFTRSQLGTFRVENGVAEVEYLEHLAYTCLRCGYTIERPCLDAK